MSRNINVTLQRIKAAAIQYRDKGIEVEVYDEVSNSTKKMCTGGATGEGKARVDAFLAIFTQIQSTTAAGTAAASTAQTATSADPGDQEKIIKLLALIDALKASSSSTLKENIEAVIPQNFFGDEGALRRNASYHLALSQYQTTIPPNVTLGQRFLNFFIRTAARTATEEKTTGSSQKNKI